jgi:hypothetical protein
MDIVLTDKRKEFPVDPASFATSDSSQSTAKAKSPLVFLASKE